MKKLLLILCLILCSCSTQPQYTLYVYYANGCRVCDSLMKLVVNDIEDEYGKKIEVIRLDIDEEENIESYAKICSELKDYELNEDSGEVPFLVLEGKFAKGGFDILETDLLKEAIINSIEGKQIPGGLNHIYYFKE